MEGREFDLSALHREPTKREWSEFREAGLQGHLGPDYASPSGVGCAVIGWLVVTGLVVFSVVHWREGAGTWALVIESAIVAALVIMGLVWHFRGQPGKERQRVAEVQFAWANGIKVWYGEDDAGVPVAARAEGFNERTMEVTQRFVWTMSGRDVQAGEFFVLPHGDDGRHVWPSHFRYVAVRHDGDLPRCRYGPITGSALDSPSTTNELDWKRVDLDDDDPPTRWVWCENRAPARVRELFCTEWLQELDAFDRVTHLEVDREWVSLGLDDKWEEVQPWEDTIGAVDLVIEKLVCR